MTTAPKLGKNEKVLRAVQPNYGIQLSYRKKLNTMIDAMHASAKFFLARAYRKHQPEIMDANEILAFKLASDVALPADELRRVIRRLVRQWQKQFDETAPKLAVWFGRSANLRSQRVLQKILRDGGFSVRFRLTRAQRDVLEAIIAENVALIRSIPSQYFTQIEGMVMRSVQSGRNIRGLIRDLERQYRVTRRRATLIARDQNNKATASLTRVRQLEAGINKAIWMHSSAGKTPRPSHVRQNGKPYNVATGWYDPDEKAWIQPGQLINCRCTSKPIVPGFS